MAATYTYLACDLLSQVPITELPLYGVTFDRKLSDSGSGQGTFRLQTGSNYMTRNARWLEGTLPGARSIFVFRERQIVAGGYITSREWSSTGQYVTIFWTSFEGFPDDVWIDHNFSYTGQDQRNAFVALWEDMMVLDGCQLSIQMPDTFPTEVVKDVVVKSYERKFYRSPMDDLAVADNGFDWRIDYEDNGAGAPLPHMRVGYPELGAKASGVTFEYDSDPLHGVAGGGNVPNYYLTENLDGAGHRVIVVGSGDGSSAPTAQVTDTERLSRGFRRKDVFLSMDTSNASTLAARARAELAKRSMPINKPSLTLKGDVDPQFGSWALGDELNLAVRDPRFPDGALFPIRPVALTVTAPSAQSNEIVALTLAGMDST